MAPFRWASGADVAQRRLRDLSKDHEVLEEEQEEEEEDDDDLKKKNLSRSRELDLWIALIREAPSW